MKKHTLQKGRKTMDWMSHIKNYVPCNEQEEKDKEMILSCIDKFSDVLTRNNPVAHMTSSALVVNKSRDKVLMIYHNIYNSWGWTGGHADGEEDLLSVAVREVQEETGVKTVHPVTSKIFSLDVLPVVGHLKKGHYISAHLHLNTTFLVEAFEEEALTVKEDENSGVKWIPIDKMVSSSTEPHMKVVYEKLIMKLRNFNRWF